MRQHARAENLGIPEPSGREAAVATPMMSQYLELKAANPGLLLFYRMGDFYELFFDDAEIASRALGIALTKRGKHMGEDVRMCGVPVRAADDYLEKLIRLGHRVAICEQVEEPAEARRRGSKALMRREIVRLITPGTLTEDKLLEPARSNYLLALAPSKADGRLALAWVDISTGQFFVTSCSPGELIGEITRIDPRELLLPETILAEPQYSALRQMPVAITSLPLTRFDSSNGELRLKAHFAVAVLEAYGQFSRAELGAAGALLDYILLTQLGRCPTLAPPRRISEREVMSIDAAARSSLELVRSLSGERRGSLLAAIDRTMSGAGARLLAQRLSAPLADVAAIEARLDAVSFFTGDSQLRQAVRSKLAELPEMGRPLARLSLERGGPRDLVNIGRGLSVAASVAALMQESAGLAGTPPEIAAALRDLAIPALEDLRASIAQALSHDPPALARDGNFVVTGYRADLDEAMRLKEESRKVIAELQAAYAAKTGLKSLKIRQNNFLGYFVELNRQNGEVLQQSSFRNEFIHRQTIAGAMRFTTAELTDLEQRIASAAQTALEIELEVFRALLSKVREADGSIIRAAEALAVIDVAAGLAQLAVERSYVRPVVDETLTFSVKSGRHPVVEQSLAETEGVAFIANDCELGVAPNGRRILLLTGPNMAGKSTFLRQNAIIAILAQIGSFVPAAQAHIGVVDRLFSRVGAADDLAKGRSTFMVEMLETAAILNQATLRSFVILDEIGRGTATFDGLSIAWAALEHLHDVTGCRALFATHFHELTALASRLPSMGNITMKVKEWQNDIVFLHEVGPGAADRSYGIHVAKRAGLPANVIARAEQVLATLERSELSSARRELIDDLPLFASASPISTLAPSAVEARLAEIAPDELTPLQALELVYQLRSLTTRK